MHTIYLYGTLSKIPTSIIVAHCTDHFNKFSIEILYHNNSTDGDDIAFRIRISELLSAEWKIH